MQVNDILPEGVPTVEVTVTVAVAGRMVDHAVTVAVHDLEHYANAVTDFTDTLLPDIFAQVTPEARALFHNHCDDLLGAQREGDTSWVAAPPPGD